jgi:hypothetical protein
MADGNFKLFYQTFRDCVRIKIKIDIKKYFVVDLGLERIERD